MVSRLWMEVMFMSNTFWVIASVSLWWGLGIVGMVWLVTTYEDFTVTKIPFAVFGGILGPMVYPYVKFVGWIVDENPSIVIFKKGGSR